MRNLYKKVLNKIEIKFIILKAKLSKTYYLSIGENCLTDNILNRYQIKSFSTPYSHGRSNLDYILQIEKDNYNNLLNNKHLYYDYVGQTKVVRNNYYLITENIYTKLHQNGFEFTHHDVINNESDRNSLLRKVSRMISLDNSRKIKFFYHYRSNNNMNINLIIKRADEFLNLYRIKGIDCILIIFTQTIIREVRDRGLSKIFNENNIICFEFKTLKIWGGDNPDDLWARNDEDLIKKMIKQVV